MYKLNTNISTQSEEYGMNYNRNILNIKEYKNILRKVVHGGPTRNIEKHIKRGKLFVRDRINKLIDSDSAFLELSPLAAFDQYNNQFPSAGIITGIGIIHGIETVIIANDATVKGGTYIKETIKKHLRAQEIAHEHKLPCVYMVDSGGIHLPDQAEVFPDKDDFGRIFYNQARMSALGIPQISIVMGSCTAGGAYIPAMSDETIMVKEQGTIFIGGPPLVKAATGETISAEELGGAEVHTSISGVADHMAVNEEHALHICRNIFESLGNIYDKKTVVEISYEEPVYDVEELYGIVPADLRKVFDPREIIMRITDHSRFHEFKKKYGTSLVTGFTKIMGYDAGIIANYGFLNSEASLKGAHFIELCNFRKVPIIFLQNITGFMVGKDVEHKGIAKDGAKMVHAVANSNVPKFTVITGGSYGAGNYAMAGRAYNPGMLFMWPTSKIGVMGGEQAANVLTTVKRNQLLNAGTDINEDDMNILKEEILDKYNKESSAYYSTSRLWDDGIIDPRDTRVVLGLCLSFSSKHDVGSPKNGIFRM